MKPLVSGARMSVPIGKVHQRLGGQLCSIRFMIDRRLRLLRLVRHYGTVTEAARVLHLTPSAVSQQVRALSRDLGVELLQRHGRRVRLTPAADLVLEHADALHARWEQAQADLDAYRRGERGPVRLCGFPSAVVALLTPAAEQLRQEAPDLDLEILQAEPDESLGLLLAGEADLAVLEASPATPATTDPRFDQQLLLDDPLQLIVPTGHALARRTRVALEAVADEPWVAGPTEASSHQIVLLACNRAGFTPHFAHRALDWSAYIALVGAGLGVALVPRLAVTSTRLVRRLSLENSPMPTRRILTCVRRGSENQPRIRRLRQALHESAQPYHHDDNGS
jgi:DNA-binding transcriptional LysR family regulator